LEVEEARAEKCLSDRVSHTMTSDADEEYLIWLTAVKVAGRNNVVTRAMTFMAVLSRAAV